MIKKITNYHPGWSALGELLLTPEHDDPLRN